ncbi:MAG: ACP S-malonyltransferase [Chloroflexia bacterium]
MATCDTAPTAWVFPGQGSQTVGMGRDLAERYPAVAALYEQADALLGFPLSRLCFEGPEAELMRTENAQPALLTTSVAVLLALGSSLDSEGFLTRPSGFPEPILVAGHSLGEYTALVAAGVLSFPDALRLVRERGRLMAEARAGGMAAVLGLEKEALEEICQACRRLGPLVIANDNCPGQLVLSGATEALEAAMTEARARGAQRVVPLKVSAAFHSPLMEAAAAGLKPAIAQTRFRAAQVPIVANTDAQLLREPEQIRRELYAQIVSPVCWTPSVRRMADSGTQRFLEIGPGRVLAGLIRRTVPEAEVVSVGTAEQVAALLAGRE